MEYPFASKEQGEILWVSPRAQTSAVLEEPFNNNMSELMNFDAYAGWCNTPLSAPDPMLAYSYGYSPFEPLNFAEQNPVGFSIPEGDMSFNNSDEDKTMITYQDTDPQFGPAVDLDTGGDSFDDREHNMIEMGEGSFIPKPFSQTPNKQHKGFVLHHTDPQFGPAMDLDTVGSIIPRALSQTLSERMLKALSLFKESSGGAILAQVWVPIKQGDEYLLSTSEQPYLLDQMLAGYREVSRAFTFSAEVKPGSFPGLPGRVYTSKVPEWTSNVGYYKKPEYLRLQHAAAHEIRGSIALPVFEESSCCAVLELVTMREKLNFDTEMENVCRALQAVNLKSTAPPRLLPQSLSKNQRAALAEIMDVLRAVCHAHTLPLALTWIPCCYDDEVGDENKRVHVRGGNASLKEKCILCVEETACYVTDNDTQGFVHACKEHYLDEGQGVAGKALKSNHPFFFPDVKAYDISEYPLVHHARKYRLTAAVAIRLRSTYTGNDDYILEFFLPINMKGGTEQQLLLDNLSGTMQRICKSLRTVSEAELIGTEYNSKIDFQNASVSFLDCNVDQMPLDLSNTTTGGSESVGIPRNKVSAIRRAAEKKRSTAEKHVSLSVLQQYFSGSLKDAAKSIGVCPTTLKRICRQHGISRWPSRKINKVNRSLQKIQTVLDSVEGVKGGLKFNTISGLSFKANNTTDTDTQVATFYPTPSSFNHSPSSIVKVEEVSFNHDPKPFHSENISCFEKEREKRFGQMISENSDSHFVSVSSSSLAAAADANDEKMDCIIDGCDDATMNPDEYHPTSSGMTDSSKSNSSCSRSTSERMSSKFKKGYIDGGSRISVKATYKEDTIRFKFEPGEGCHRLYDEVAKRFNLQTGAFQLKYLDDEEEWVMLVSDSDLQECIEILDYVGTRCVKFLVRDVPFGMGSSGSSNNFLSGGS